MESTAGKGQSQGLTQGVRRHIAVHVSWPSQANIYTHSSLRGEELWVSAAWLVVDPNVKWKFSRNSRPVKLVRQFVPQSQECNLLINSNSASQHSPGLPSCHSLEWQISKKLKNFSVFFNCRDPKSKIGLLCMSHSLPKTSCLLRLQLL